MYCFFLLHMASVIRSFDHRQSEEDLILSREMFGGGEDGRGMS